MVFLQPSISRRIQPQKIFQVTEVLQVRSENNTYYLKAINHDQVSSDLFFFVILKKL